MIRFKDKVFEEYFIDPITAVITDLHGNIKKQWVHKGYFTTSIHSFKIAVHQIQAHTAFGYKKGYDIHHLDENKLNNSLSNLQYIPPDIHTSITHKGKHRSECTKTKLSIIASGENNSMYGRNHTDEAKTKMSCSKIGRFWWNNGFEAKIQKECPGDGWVRRQNKVI